MLVRSIQYKFNSYRHCFVRANTLSFQIFPQHQIKRDIQTDRKTECRQTYKQNLDSLQEFYLMKAILSSSMLHNPKREHFQQYKGTFLRFPSCIIMIDLLRVSIPWAMRLSMVFFFIEVTILYRSSIKHLNESHKPFQNTEKIQRRCNKIHFAENKLYLLVGPLIIMYI